MRADAESIARIQATFAAVTQRAGGLCEECGARRARPICLLEGLAAESNTLCLCEQCEPIVSRRIGALATVKDLEAAVAERIARAAQRR